jgi:hypothetical protein
MTISGSLVSFRTSTVTGLPSAILRIGPVVEPLYPMVLNFFPGASSTVTLEMRIVKSGFSPEQLDPAPPN